MPQGIHLFHLCLNDLGQELAQVELPGELWPVIEELTKREREMFINYYPKELQTSFSNAYAVDIDEFLQRQDSTMSQDAALEIIRPYVMEALDLGYNYVILAA